MTRPLTCAAASFAQLDGVFLKDCPICAVNLKIMWCSYACNSQKGTFSKCNLPRW